ncbi:MAG: signal recognition particle protein, partial [Micrococcales bacterium]|nr:signal recognition particle protein [Micrococcales bacterium]
DAVNVAKAFEDGVGITGVVLTKLDGDARGGAALSVAQVTGKPIVFASTGESLDAFEPFYPDRMASRILDMGDILTLIEQAQKSFDEEQAMEMAQKLAKDTFTLEDFMDQMQQLKKMGSIKNMLAMMPGAGKLRSQLDNIDEKEIDRTEAIIRSMTPKERRDPKILNGSRRLRIAKGSGMTVTDVNSLVNRFEQAAKMMKTMAKGGNPGIPGMPQGMQGFGGAGSQANKNKKAKAKKGGKSGNPAKRAAEAAGLPTQNPTEPGAGSAFGLK